LGEQTPHLRHDAVRLSNAHTCSCWKAGCNSTWLTAGTISQGSRRCCRSRVSEFLGEVAEYQRLR
jgi:hypothetical protein